MKKICFKKYKSLKDYDTQMNPSIVRRKTGQHWHLKSDPEKSKK
jgi:hypothetical protein